MSALAGYEAAVITVSDRCARGDMTDTAGPAVATALAGAGAHVETRIVPDGIDSVRHELETALSRGVRIIVTTGGTGVAPRDVTPEATAPLIERDLPGVAELLRREGAQSTPSAALSRGLAGLTAGPPHVVIVNLPGSQRGAREGIATLLTVLPHLLNQVEGGDH